MKYEKSFGNPSMKHNDQYMNMKGGSIGNGVMDHDSKVYHVDPMPNRDLKKVKENHQGFGGTPVEAFKYKY